MKEKLAVYAGTFDPLTVGHLWMIEQGAALFDKLIMMRNQGKANNLRRFDLKKSISFVDLPVMGPDGHLEIVV